MPVGSPEMCPSTAEQLRRNGQSSRLWPGLQVPNSIRHLWHVSDLWKPHRGSDLVLPRLGLNTGGPLGVSCGIRPLSMRPLSLLGPVGSVVGPLLIRLGPACPISARSAQDQGKLELRFTSWALCPVLQATKRFLLWGAAYMSCDPTDSAWKKKKKKLCACYTLLTAPFVLKTIQGKPSNTKNIQESLETWKSLPLIGRLLT